MNDVPSMPVGVQARLSFHCSGCGRELIAGLEASGVEAPCPSCGTMVRAPVLGRPDTPAPPSPQAAPEPEADAPERRAGGVPPDGMLDRDQIDKGESVKMIRIIISVALVLAICTVVALVVRSHFLSGN